MVVSHLEPDHQDVADTAERRLPEFTTATQAEKFKEQEKSVAGLHLLQVWKLPVGNCRLATETKETFAQLTVTT